MQNAVAEYRVNPKVVVLENPHDAIDHFVESCHQITVEKRSGKWGMSCDPMGYIHFPIYVVIVDDCECCMNEERFFKKFTLVENAR